MKMKRYVSADMRTALRAIREEQGPDAVILSTRASSEGVEVCAAVDVELAAGQGTLAETAALKQLERAALQQLEHDAEFTSKPQQAPSSADAAVAPRFDELMSDATLSAFAMPAPEQQTGAATSVGEELRCLRALLEQQVAALAWNDFTRREPLKARALTELAKLGLDRVLSIQIVGDLPVGLSDEQVQRMPYAMLARRIPSCLPPADRSGALALIGPAGAGKTTMLAKLATRYVLEQDAANLLILSTDDERLGSHEQLACLGRLLGVRVETVIGAGQLSARIAALPGRCILIDTPGVALSLIH